MLDPFHENVARDVELSYHVTEEDNSHPAMGLTNIIRTNNNTILITNYYAQKRLVQYFSLPLRNPTLQSDLLPVYSLSESMSSLRSKVMTSTPWYRAGCRYGIFPIW